MKDIMETVINNLQYIYPGFIIMYIYQFVRGSKVEDVNIFS